MSNGYWVNWHHSIADPAMHERYVELATPALAAFGGRFLTRAAQRCVIVEFDNVANAIAAHESSAYQAALVILGSSAARAVRILEGIEAPSQQ